MRKLQRFDVPPRYHPFDLIEFTIELEHSKDYAMAAIVQRERVRASLAERALSVSVVSIAKILASTDDLEPGVVEKAWQPLITKLQKFSELSASVADVRVLTLLARAPGC